MSRSNDVPSIADKRIPEQLLRELLDERGDDLESIEPERALDLYLEDKRRECQQATVDSHRSRLGFFVEWCEEQGVNNLNDLGAPDLHEYRVWRRQDLNAVSEKTQMDTLRVFLEWCETIDAVPSGLSSKVRSPDLSDDERSRETVLRIDRGRGILSHLEKYEYASAEHVLWLILTETGMRMGGARAFDVKDYRRNAEQPHLNVVHRPEMDTPIKNGKNGERRIGLDAAACEVIDDYLERKRPDVTDGYGREPLLATPQGRVAKSTIRKYVYKWSRPCEVTGECPHDRDVEECDAATDIDQASKCPSSVTPHPIRRGYITHLLRSGVPVEVVSDRCNVSPAIIDQHYDVRTEEDKMLQRQQILDEVEEDATGA
jgi:site-specific recombinase XerD